MAFSQDELCNHRQHILLTGNQLAGEMIRIAALIIGGDQQRSG